MRELERQLLAALDREIPLCGADVCRAVGRRPRDGSVRRALDALAAQGVVVRSSEGWRRVPEGANAQDVAGAVAWFVGSLGELDELGGLRAALAAALAGKLDQLRGADTAQAALAVPGISRELRELLGEIQGASDDTQEFVAGLFASVEGSAS